MTDPTEIPKINVAMRLDFGSVLTERAKTHGNFETNANISQSIKAAIERYNPGNIPPVHRESLDLIATKISRICSGQSDFHDHWVDIIGYAKLALADIDRRRDPPGGS